MVTPRELLELVQTGRTSGKPAGNTYKPAPLSHQNEFCLFFKPEVFMKGCQSEAVLETVLSTLHSEQIVVNHFVALSADYLRAHHVMSAHYGVIDAISHNALSSISADARNKLATLIGDEDYEILGGHEFLKKYEFFNSKSLGVFYDNGNNKKLAGGTHCILVNVRGRKTALFNGFHPEQLDHYIDPGQAIVCLVCRTDREWKYIRSEMTGATNPSKGPASSLRFKLFMMRNEVGIPDLSAGRNVIHVSAGPIEGAVEISRFFSDESRGLRLSFPDTSVGALLANQAVDANVIAAVASNAVVKLAGNVGPVFDLTEEVDTWTVMAWLASTSS